MRTFLATCILCFTLFSCGKKGGGAPAAAAGALSPFFPQEKRVKQRIDVAKKVLIF